MANMDEGKEDKAAASACDVDSGEIRDDIKKNESTTETKTSIYSLSGCEVSYVAEGKKDEASTGRRVADETV